MINDETQKITEFKKRHNYNQQQCFPVGLTIFLLSLCFDSGQCLDFNEIIFPAIQECTIILYLRSALLVVYKCIFLPNNSYSPGC